MSIELGISTFGETTPLEKTGHAISHDQRIRDLVDEIVLADKVGIDGFAIGVSFRWFILVWIDYYLIVNMWTKYAHSLMKNRKNSLKNHKS